jgi:hypothetical protein
MSESNRIEINGRWVGAQQQWIFGRPRKWSYWVEDMATGYLFVSHARYASREAALAAGRADASK